jgi:lipopolysaccharide export system permease protein
MKILNRYLIIEFLKPLALSSAAFGGLVLISEFFRELNFYLEAKAPLLYVAEYLALNLPWWIIQVLPVAVLLAVLFSLGKLAKQNEITAIKAAGINVNNILILFTLIGICVGLTEVVLREEIIPFTVQKAEQVRSRISKEPQQVRNEYYDFVVSLPSENARMTVGSLIVDQHKLGNIVIDYYDDDFHLKRQVVAESAFFVRGETWKANNGVIRTYDGALKSEEYFAGKELEISFKPADFAINRTRPEQMTSAMMLDVIKKLKSVGAPSEKDEIQFYSRWASVSSHLVVILIGIPFALGLGGKHSKVLSFTFALIFAFAYWGVQAVGQSLGENKVVSPMLAAWIANIIFTIFGLLMLRKVQR